ncbi:MAG: hypothetical protein JWN60_504 [Acidobacteria bacterium]|nr:hypothetical protein [Acidobacteriota bacterium]
MSERMDFFFIIKSKLPDKNRFKAKLARQTRETSGNDKNLIFPRISQKFSKLISLRT